MIEREGGKIAFCCDLCSETLETDTSDFQEARGLFRSADWLTRKRDEAWVHFCPNHTPEEVARASD